MAITKIQSESLNLADDFAFTGTITGAGESNVPAFEAKTSSSQTLSPASVTKMQCNTKILDTNNFYDNTTNYRFTPTIAGKYLFYGKVNGDSSTQQIGRMLLYLSKNGSTVNSADIMMPDSSKIRKTSLFLTTVVDMNGTSDYLEIYCYLDGSGTLSATSANIGAFLLTT